MEALVGVVQRLLTTRTDAMDPGTRKLFFSAANIVASTQHAAVIDAVFSGATEIGSFSGATGLLGIGVQASFRHGGFIDSCFFEWGVTSTWGANTGFVGILDAAHWNAGPSFSSSIGERAMMYFGQDGSFGGATGTVREYGDELTFDSGDVCGCVYNDSNGRFAVYKNGILGPVYTNTAFVGITKYPCVSYFAGASSLTATMRTTPSTYAGNYLLPN